MMMNDPIGDMLTRIRNSQMRGKSTVKTPASKLRAWVLDVLVAEGYIRGYESAPTENGQSELTISLKYFEGTPIPTSFFLVIMLAVAANMQAIGANMWFGQIVLGGFTLHPLSLAFGISGSLMISRIRIPKP